MVALASEAAHGWWHSGGGGWCSGRDSGQICVGGKVLVAALMLGRLGGGAQAAALVRLSVLGRLMDSVLEELQSRHL
jgi:hypothetical protein